MDLWGLGFLGWGTGERLSSLSPAIYSGAIAAIVLALCVVFGFRAIRRRDEARRQSVDLARSHEARLLLQALRDRPVVNSPAVETEAGPNTGDGAAKLSTGDGPKLSKYLDKLNAEDSAPPLPAPIGKQRLSIVRRT